MGDNSSNPQRGQYNPGWNDPPKLEYTSSTNQTGKTKLNLNKRIAFPLQSSSTVNTSKPTAIVQPSPSLLPLNALASSSNTQSPISQLTATTQPPVAIVTPMPQMNPSLPPLHRIPPLDSTINQHQQQQQLINSNNRNSQGQQYYDNDDIEINENSREYCLNIFQRFICRIQESTNVRSDEVQRRINLMNQMWLSGTLTSCIHRKLLKIAKALEVNNFNDAIENHRALVVNHSNMCAAWGAALRQIILTIQQQDNRIDAQTTSMNSSTTTNILIPTTTAINETTLQQQQQQQESENESQLSNNIQHI